MSLTPEYLELVDRVKKIDERAAYYMLEEAPKDAKIGFRPVGSLKLAFYWGSTPAGYDYWLRIARELARKANDSMQSLPSVSDKPDVQLELNGVKVGSEWRSYTDRHGEKVTRLVVTKIKGDTIFMEDYAGSCRACSAEKWYTYFVPFFSPMPQ